MFWKASTPLYLCSTLQHPQEEANQSREAFASLYLEKQQDQCEPGWPLATVAMDMESPQLIQTLIESFNALAGEVQDLVDRKTILEHKLRFAHEQVCRYSFLSLSSFLPFPRPQHDDQ